MLAIRGPIPETHHRYVESLNASTDTLRQLLQNWDIASQSLPNRDLDTGEKARPGQYRPTDQTYAKLLNAITQQPSQDLPPELKQDILQYYSDPQAPISTKSDRDKWARVQKQLIFLKGMNIHGPYTTNGARYLNGP